MDINNIFTNHPVTEDQSIAYDEIRLVAKNLANAIIQFVPAGADQTEAIRKVREAVFTANAGIALGGKL